MRFNLTLNIDKDKGNRLPFNYQYELSAAIYRILEMSDSKFSDWLHNNGYNLGGKRFKLFSFSNLRFGRYKIEINKDDGKNSYINIDGDKAYLDICFWPERSTMEFINGLLQNGTLSVFNAHYRIDFKIVNIQREPTVTDFGSCKFKALSPICVKQHKGTDTVFLCPTDPQYAKGILNGLKSRYRIATGNEIIMDDSDFSFEVIPGSKPKSKLITIKAEKESETRVRGYMFDFYMKAPAELMHFAYESGIGEECSQGFGYIKLK